MNKIQMVNLISQYNQIQVEMDDAVSNAIRSGQYINGKEVDTFRENLVRYTGARYAIPCGNGTDALQISLMALGLNPGDEVIVPAFTYAAAAECIALLNLVPVVVDVEPSTFNMDADKIMATISPRTKAIIPVHLFGQCCDMASIKENCDKQHIFILEDNAQSIGSVYSFPDGTTKQAGTIGVAGTLSFFPTKNLGCYGDGGAILTDDEQLAGKLKKITQHGQSKKYHHELIGCNSRLDTLQAAILDVKLKYLDKYATIRKQAADYYRKGLSQCADYIELPIEKKYSTHVYNQFVIKVKNSSRSDLQAFLKEHEVPTMIYYPLPLHKQEAFKDIVRIGGDLSVSEELCETVLALPMHTELEKEQQNYIIDKINQFFS